MRCRYFINMIFVLALVAANAAAQSQSGKKSSPRTEKQLAEQLTKSRADLVNAAKEYRTSLEKLLALIEADVELATEAVEKRKELYARSIISRRELEAGEQALSDVQRKAEETRKEIAETDDLIAEASAAVELPPIPRGTYRATAAIIRYSGSAAWIISDISKVESFFVSRFGRVLPISALGQSATHNRLGFDHRNNVDVALHPDSAEGEALMAYLRSAGIPFIAFRHAVAGSATGAHIHIGNPSHRLVR
ncbi:MAG: hypothetical protein L0229_09895 [Blastocatellia bacterium]|nr:hypothetical protein [Blastocatellia bacterium]